MAQRGALHGLFTRHQAPASRHAPARQTLIVALGRPGLFGDRHGNSPHVEGTDADAVRPYRHHEDPSRARAGHTRRRSRPRTAARR